jgi:hypothetical protein
MSSARRISKLMTSRPRGARRRLNLGDRQRRIRVPDTRHDGQSLETGDNFAQEFNALAHKTGDAERQAGNIAARARQTRDEASANRFPHDGRDDWDERGRLLGCDDRRGSRRDNDVDLEANELSCDFGKAFAATLPQRTSIATVRPSIQPSSRNRCTNAAFHWAWVEGVPVPKRPMVGTLPACCARAASGHAAAPPSSVMNSRR